MLTFFVQKGYRYALAQINKRECQLYQIFILKIAAPFYFEWTQ